ncbi:hypothetical protein GLUCOINTEAF2_0202481 [Komagataeibacter intermedius AF2]|uniref:Uncharacterized protein n=1 Tax=Komagataeibacter intermedius AF2 TaxID=1458464 RepID=A0A0N1FKX7_9PROT|nr:hypothetical protein GLUCOINTEAF2_0202481 [Komagataeibacter intermedius AF2]
MNGGYSHIEKGRNFDQLAATDFVHFQRDSGSFRKVRHRRIQTSNLLPPSDLGFW